MPVIDPDNHQMQIVVNGLTTASLSLDDIKAKYPKHDVIGMCFKEQVVSCCPGEGRGLSSLKTCYRHAANIGIDAFFLLFFFSSFLPL